MRLPGVETKISKATAKAAARDAAKGGHEVGQRAGSPVAVEAQAQGWRKQEDGCCTGLSLQGISYRDRQS